MALIAAIEFHIFISTCMKQMVLLESLKFLKNQRGGNLAYIDYGPMIIDYKVYLTHQTHQN